MSFFSRKKIDDNSSLQTLEQKERVIPDNAVETKLHFPNDWDMTTKEKYIYQYHHKKLPKIELGQLSITGIKFLEINGEIAVEALIQNAAQRPVEFQAVDLVLFDDTNKLAAKKRFLLDHLGELPPLTSTPWRFLFLAEDRFTDALVTDKWRINFIVKTSINEEVLDLDGGWEERLTLDKKIFLEGILGMLPELGHNEVNIYGVELNLLDNLSLEVRVLIRNGTSRELQFNRLPLIVEDAAGDIVCQGNLELPHLKVKPHVAKLWAFVFSANLIVKQNPDFSDWKIYASSNM